MTSLLAIGDIHLGRSPAALHSDLQAQRTELGPEAAWSRCVNEALERGVDGVLLAGDVVERSRDLLVAYGDLKQGIDRLAAAGIPVMAVAGNHDTLVLPRLAAEIESLHLLGAGGRWEEKSVGKLRVLGWSFPRPHVRHNPLRDLPPIDRPERVVGLLHCDRDQSDSPYAPVTSQELRATRTAAWLLGHIHQPDQLDGERPVGYLGSVSALRASDIGPRGPWLIEWREGRVSATHLPLAPLRFDRLEVNLEPLRAPDEIAEAVLAASRCHVEALADQAFVPDVIGLRLRLTGRCRFEQALAGVAEDLVTASRPWKEGSVRLFVQKVLIATEAATDLERLARQDDPCGLLARRILILSDSAHPELEALIQRARPRLADAAGQKEFRELETNMDDERVRRWLLQAARAGLSALLGQKQGAS
ncbi:MAG: DNA repair exonuclease [Wenzhouxiangella sp.]|jgi:DNA repair exonuclease SbcCD nuclease subunit|nr:DNA repair exonuclease [Wenzhouxiangella sp.]